MATSTSSRPPRPAPRRASSVSSADAMASPRSAPRRASSVSSANAMRGRSSSKGSADGSRSTSPVGRAEELGRAGPSAPVSEEELRERLTGVQRRLQKEGVRVSALESKLREERSRAAELETELNAARGPRGPPARWPTANAMPVSESDARSTALEEQLAQEAETLQAERRSRQELATELAGWKVRGEAGDHHEQLACKLASELKSEEECFSKKLQDAQFACAQRIATNNAEVQSACDQRLQEARDRLAVELKEQVERASAEVADRFQEMLKKEVGEKEAAFGQHEQQTLENHSEHQQLQSALRASRAELEAHKVDRAQELLVLEQRRLDAEDEVAQLRQHLKSMSAHEHEISVAAQGWQVRNEEKQREIDSLRAGVMEAANHQARMQASEQEVLEELASKLEDRKALSEEVVQLQDRVEQMTGSKDKVSASDERRFEELEAVEAAGRMRSEDLDRQVQDLIETLAEANNRAHRVQASEDELASELEGTKKAVLEQEKHTENRLHAALEQQLELFSEQQQDTELKYEERLAMELQMLREDRNYWMNEASDTRSSSQSGVSKEVQTEIIGLTRWPSDSNSAEIKRLTLQISTLQSQLEEQRSEFEYATTMLKDAHEEIALLKAEAAQHHKKMVDVQEEIASNKRLAERLRDAQEEIAALKAETEKRPRELRRQFQSPRDATADGQLQEMQRLLQLAYEENKELRERVNSQHEEIATLEKQILGALDDIRGDEGTGQRWGVGAGALRSHQDGTRSSSVPSRAPRGSSSTSASTPPRKPGDIKKLPSQIKRVSENNFFKLPDS